MSKEPNDAINDYDELEDSETIERKPWQFQSGNQASVGQSRDTGVVAYVKKHTKGATEMIDVLINVMRGDETALGFKVNANHRMEAVHHLLDRAIGKPKQTIEESGDSSTREVLQTMQALLKAKNTGDTTDAPIAPVEGNISAIDAMKRKGSG